MGCFTFVKVMMILFNMLIFVSIPLPQSSVHKMYVGTYVCMSIECGRPILLIEVAFVHLWLKMFMAIVKKWFLRVCVCVFAQHESTTNYLQSQQSGNANRYVRGYRHTSRHWTEVFKWHHLHACFLPRCTFHPINLRSFNYATFSLRLMITPNDTSETEGNFAISKRFFSPLSFGVVPPGLKSHCKLNNNGWK